MRRLLLRRAALLCTLLCTLPPWPAAAAWSDGSRPTGARLVVGTDGVVRDRGTGAAFLARGVNFGMRLTPKPAPAAKLYNASDPLLVKRLFPGANLIRLVRAVRAPLTS